MIVNVKRFTKKSFFWMTKIKTSATANIPHFVRKLKTILLLLCKIKSNSENNYHNIMKYFEQSGLFEKGKIAVVDSGWMGTVQKTLTALVNGRTDENVLGYYFGLYRREDAESARRSCSDVTDAYKYVPTFCNNLFERFCSAPHGMTTGYRECDGKIIPVLSDANAEMVKMAEIQTKNSRKIYGIMRVKMKIISRYAK